LHFEVVAIHRPVREIGGNSITSESSEDLSLPSEKISCRRAIAAIAQNVN
jgi:hypothetical protein